MIFIKSITVVSGPARQHKEFFLSHIFVIVMFEDDFGFWSLCLTLCSYTVEAADGSGWVCGHHPQPRAHRGQDHLQPARLPAVPHVLRAPGMTILLHPYKKDKDRRDGKGVGGKIWFNSLRRYSYFAPIFKNKMKTPYYFPIHPILKIVQLENSLWGKQQRRPLPSLLYVSFFYA